MKDYIFKANEMLSELLPKENDYEYDDLIFPELQPNPCIYLFTKIQNQTLCTLSKLDIIQIISTLNNYIPLKPIKLFYTLIQIDSGTNRSITNNLNNL